MNKNLLEIVMPASLAVVAGAIGSCLLLLGSNLAVEPPADLVNQSMCAGPGMDGPTDLIPPPQMTVAEALNVASGDALFKGNCAQCHAIQEVVVGPALASIRQRRPEKWLHAWVKNSGKLVASGDEYAVKIYEQYQKQQMPSFQLSDEEITQILDYVQAVEGQGTGLAAN